MSNDTWPQHPGGEEGRRAEILHRFDTFTVGENQGAALAKSREYFYTAAAFILKHSKPGREQSLALTALEEAKYWTNQSIAKDGVPADLDNGYITPNPLKVELSEYDRGLLRDLARMQITIPPNTFDHQGERP